MILREKMDIEDLWKLDDQFYPERMKFYCLIYSKNG